MLGIRPPTRIRALSSVEYGIVSPVFGATLPARLRVFVTNGAGINGRAFTIPTSLLSMVLGVGTLTFLPIVTVGYLASALNVAYLINAGDAYDRLATTEQALLVHEMTHVWQGKNSVFALSYVVNSVFNQCVRGDAYRYVPGQPWSSYNVEQQASIVEDWFSGGQLSTSDLYPYIIESVRTGRA